MRRSPGHITPEEAKNFREFVAFAASQCEGGQTELAKRAGISQAMVSSILSSSRAFGQKTLRAIALATSVSVEDALSGVGLTKLRARTLPANESAAVAEKLRAARALAELYLCTVGEVMAVFDELGVSLPAEVDATRWFDVGRAAFELQLAGRPISRRQTLSKPPKTK